MRDKPRTTFAGTVEKIIPTFDPKEPEKAQISVEGAEDLYKEIRIKNALKDENEQVVKLKPGAKVELTVQAEQENTISDKKPAA